MRVTAPEPLHILDFILDLCDSLRPIPRVAATLGRLVTLLVVDMYMQNLQEEVSVNTPLPVNRMLFPLRTLGTQKFLALRSLQTRDRKDAKKQASSTSPTFSRWGRGHQGLRPEHLLRTQLLLKPEYDAK